MHPAPEESWPMRLAGPPGAFHGIFGAEERTGAASGHRRRPTWEKLWAIARNPFSSTADARRGAGRRGWGGHLHASGTPAMQESEETLNENRPDLTKTLKANVACSP